jgi:hypothetical protein
MHHKLFYLSVVLFCTVNIHLFAQSTSNWIKVQSSSEKNTIERNSGYLSLSVVNSKIFHKSNWWSELVGKNKKAFYTINVSSSYPNGTNISNRWSSDQVAIQKEQKPVEIGWSQMLAKELPSTFTSLKVNITLGYNSQDGVEKVIGIVSDLSKTVPPLAPIQSYMGAVSGTKAILDELFSKNLAGSYLNSNNELIPSAQNSIEAGFYVVFGEKTTLAYQKYKDGSTKLYWNGHDLLFEDKPIDDVNYVVIRVELVKNLFPKKDINLLTNTEIPWVKFYIKSNQTIDNWTKLEEGEKVMASVREDFAAAKALLDNDPLYIFSEKEDIHNTLKNLLSAKYTDRMQVLKNGVVFISPK